MKDLTTDLDDKVVKALQYKVSTYEVEISELKDILEKKDEEIANIAKSRDSMSSELEDTKGKMSELVNKTSELDKLNSEVYDLKKTITLKDDELKKLNAEVDDLKKEVAKLNENLKEKEKKFEEQRAKLEKAEKELSALKPAEPAEYTSEERLICPKCGARGKDLKVEEDKSKVLGYIGHSPMYGKTNVCKKCGEKF
jgi:chromosome segregation ATPase